MTKTISSHDQFVQEDYIDIDPNSMSTTVNAPPSWRNSRDQFEFKLCPNPQERCSYNDSPADELFYKGILLPLHLHPRIQTIQRLLLHERNPHHSIPIQEEDELDKESVSSCRYASEGYEYLTMQAQCGTTNNSWSNKFKGLGSSSLCSKLKAPHTYLKSLFAKPARSNDYVKTISKDIIGKDLNSLKCSVQRDKLMEEDELVLSVAKLCPTTRSNSLYSNSSWSSSSSSLDLSFLSLNSNEFAVSLTQAPALRRSSSVNSEMESSIQGAITYCKKSQNLVPGQRVSVILDSTPFDS